MEDVIDIRLALTQLGEGWQFGGSVTEGTQAAWDAVDWEDIRPKPSWNDLREIYASMPPALSQPVIITSDNITYDDADALCQAMGAGEKTAAWIVAKLDL